MSTQTEQEQIEEIKNFWGNYGKPIFIGVLIAITIIAVWKFWQSHQIAKKTKEAQVYQLLMMTMAQPVDKINMKDVVGAAESLQSESPNSYYAQYAKFYVAKLAVETGKLDQAVTELKAVLDKPADAVIAELARQRLAQVFIAQNKLDDASQLLDTPVDKAFSISRLELKGDVLLKKGDIDKARDTYSEALTLAKEAKSANQIIIKMKLDDLAKEDI